MADEIEGFPKLKVEDLKRELQKRGLPVRGTKAELQERLLEYLKKDVALDSDSPKDKDDVDIDDDDDNINNDSEVDNNDDLVPSNDDEEDLDIAAIPELDDVLDVKAPETDGKEVKTNETGSQQETETTKPLPVRKSIPVTEEEKRTARGKRFGEVSNEVDKKKLRAERFKTGGVTGEVNVKGKQITGDALEKLKKRADRFGVVSPVMEKLDESERKEKRQQRFGVATSVSTTPLKDSVDARKKKRMERFGKQ